MVLLYRETLHCSRRKKREASGSVRQALLPFLLPPALHIFCRLHLLCGPPIPLCNLRLFAVQLCQDGCPAILPPGGHIIPPAVHHVVVLFFVYLGTEEILAIVSCRNARWVLSLGRRLPAAGILKRFSATSYIQSAGMVPKYPVMILSGSLLRPMSWMRLP